MTRPPSQQPGAWAGTYALIFEGGVGITCGPDKWAKAKQLLQSLQEELASTPQLNHKGLEQKRGFFVHLQRTYPCITPFLKGMHLTLDSWRPGRDADGWKAEVSSNYDDLIGVSTLHPCALEFVTAVPRLYDDLECLAQLLLPAHPPIRFIRSNKVASICYGFGDASSEGFGSSILLPDGTTSFRHGTWGADMESASSNYRELLNQVETLEEGLRTGELHQLEIFLFTDNTSAEGCFYKGNSPSRTLFSLILHLCCLEMSGQMRLHMIHVAGSRMIAQGTDGLSRGHYASGVMSGLSMLEFVPLHLLATSAHPDLLLWIRSWFPTADMLPLPPEGWFTTGHGIAGGSFTSAGRWSPLPASSGAYLWAPAPAAASAAVDQLSLSRFKRTQLLHVLVCPRLMTHLWRKKLFKVADLVLELPPDVCPVWPAAMHEPIILALILPFILFPPWHLRNSAPVLDLGRGVRQMWDSPPEYGRALLRKLCQLPSTLAGLPPDVVRAMLYPAPSGQVLSVCADG
jgi:hypothetical protein